MRDQKLKIQRYRKRKSMRAMRRLSQLKKSRRNANHYLDFESATSSKSFQNDKPIIVKAPEVFDLINNTKGTTAYFAEVQRKISRCMPKSHLFFDLSETKSVSVDAIMYLIALIYNTKKIQLLGINCSGNEPREKSALDTLNQAGFFQYVSSRFFHPTDRDNKRIKIVRGDGLDNKLAARLCDFVHTHSIGRVGKRETRRLYAMLIELMSNTHQHAYKNLIDISPKMNCNWYIYVVDKDDYIEFVFLDTGIGIPKTIRRTWQEKLTDVILTANDAYYIASALRGEFRTETKEYHRGKGLPEIYSNVQCASIASLAILSGKGMCKIDSTGRIFENTIDSEFQGALFKWQISKEAV